MKLRHCFSLMVILLILFSLSAAAASENVTDSDVFSVEDNQISVGENPDEILCESQDVGNNLSDDNIDLAVWIDVKNVQKGKLYNQPGYEVPWKITVWVKGGTAHNVKVNVVFTKTLQCLSYNESVGTFNSKTGIWTIGDLSSSNNATLSILTKLNEGKKFRTTAEVTSDSKDIDQSNNLDTILIKSGASKFDSNASQTSSDVAQPQHGFNSNSSYYNNGWLIIEEDDEEEEEEEENHEDEPVNPPVNPPDNPPVGPDDPENPNPPKQPAIKSIQSTVNFISGILDELFSSISSDSNNMSAETIKAISAQNYTKIPILIFGLFLVLLVAIVAYGKIKP